MPETSKPSLDKHVHDVAYSGWCHRGRYADQTCVLSWQVAQLPDTLAAVEQAMNDVRDKLATNVETKQLIRAQCVGHCSSHALIKALRHAISQSENIEHWARLQRPSRSLRPCPTTQMDDWTLVGLNAVATAAKVRTQQI